MRIAVTGASGLIGSALVPALSGAGHEVVRLVRRPAGAPNEVQWSPPEGMIDTKGLEGADAIVHLAAETIEQRWTAEARRRIRDSRVTGTRLIAEAAASLDPRPVLVAASGVDAYGDRADEVLTETSRLGDGFLADVAQAWEEAAAPAREAGCRVVHLRQGFVVSRDGGALARMLLPFRLGLGGRVGSGRQWWSWVALDDVVAAYFHALERPLEGVVNLAAPGVVTSAEFARTLGSVLHRPTVFPLPAFAVRLMFGEMGVSLLLASHRVEPERLLGDGFSFTYPELRGALERALAKDAPAAPGT